MKCAVGKQEAGYLGHVVSRGKTWPGPDKVKAIELFLTLRTNKDIRSFLGLAGFFCRFVPNFAVIAQPLSDRTRKARSQTVGSDNDCEVAFQTLKHILTYSPVLQCPNYERPFVLETDALGHSFGGALTQQDSNDYLHPILLISHKLLEREIRYSAIEKECLGLVWAVA